MHGINSVIVQSFTSEVRALGPFSSQVLLFTSVRHRLIASNCSRKKCTLLKSRHKSNTSKLQVLIFVRQ